MWPWLSRVLAKYRFWPAARRVLQCPARDRRRSPGSGCSPGISNCAPPGSERLRRDDLTDWILAVVIGVFHTRDDHELVGVAERTRAPDGPLDARLLVVFGHLFLQVDPIPNHVGFHLDPLHPNHRPGLAPA